MASKRILSIAATARRSPQAMADLSDRQLVDVHDRAEARTLNGRTLDPDEQTCLDKTRTELARRWDERIPTMNDRALITALGPVMDDVPARRWAATHRRQKIMDELRRRHPHAPAGPNAYALVDHIEQSTN